MTQVFELDWHLCGARWEPVYRFESGTILTKGRRSDHYRALRSAGRKVADIHGCYSWWAGSRPVYIGSFSPYGRAEFESSLEGRLHNYLQNHGGKVRPNTNAWVFGNLVTTLTSEAVELRILRFDRLLMNGTAYVFEEVSREKAVVLALETMLIASHRLSGGCSWNRTG